MNREELLKSNLENLITKVGLEKVTDYIIEDETTNYVEKTSLLMLVNIRQMKRACATPSAQTEAKSLISSINI